MKEKRLTPAESFSLGSGARGALIARTGSLIASGGSAVCCGTVVCCCCCAGCVCGFCPDASANIQSSAEADARNGLNIILCLLVILDTGFARPLGRPCLDYHGYFRASPCLSPRGQAIIREPFHVVVLIFCSNFHR